MIHYFDDVLVILFDQINNHRFRKIITRIVQEITRIVQKFTRIVQKITRIVNCVLGVRTILVTILILVIRHGDHRSPLLNDAVQTVNDVCEK